MLGSLLIGLAAGARSLTPLAVAGWASKTGALGPQDEDLAWVRSPLLLAGVSALAAGEVWGDKLKSAPDRIVPAGLIARLATAGLAGAVLAPRGKAVEGGAVAATAAIASAYLTFALRQRAMARFGQTPSGLVEDALTLALSVAATRAA